MRTRKTILFFILFLIAIETIFYLSIEHFNKVKIEKIKNSQIEKLSSELNIILNFNQKFATMIVDEILYQEKIKNLLKNLNSANETVKNRTRNELLNNLYSTYNRLVQHDFRQLHFHDKYGNSFLRFHSPQNYGDNLLEVRATVKKANETKKPQFGFEEGKVQNGFRNVFPIIIDNEFYGTVELSNSFSAMHHFLHRTYPYEYKLIISKDYVNKRAFKEIAEHYYIGSSVSDKFYEEKIKECEIEAIDKKTVSLIDAKIKENFSQKLDSFEAFVEDFKIKNEWYLVTFLPIFDFDQSINTYVLSYSKNSIINDTKQEGFSLFITLNLILSLLIILYILRVNYIQKNIFIKKAYTDTLTKLFNRSKFNVDLDKIIKEKRFCEYSVIMYDIDFFKKVNDTYGHDIGDIVLQEFSDVTKKAIRTTDLVYRWGGEEFIAIIESNSKENLILVAEKMRVAVENFNFTKIGKLTSSFGIAIPKKDDTKDSLLKRADDNLYKAKQTGRNKVVI